MRSVSNSSATLREAPGFRSPRWCERPMRRSGASRRPRGQRAGPWRTGRHFRRLPPARRLHIDNGGPGRCERLRGADPERMSRNAALDPARWPAASSQTCTRRTVGEPMNCTAPSPFWSVFEYRMVSRPDPSVSVARSAALERRRAPEKAASNPVARPASVTNPRRLRTAHACYF